MANNRRNPDRNARNQPNPNSYGEALMRAFENNQAAPAPNPPRINLIFNREQARQREIARVQQQIRDVQEVLDHLHSNQAAAQPPPYPTP